MINEQDKITEHLSGIPTDEWLDSPKVYISKRKHLKHLGLFEIGSKEILVLDAGCGPGTYGMILAKEHFDVVGVDISKIAIEKAKERAVSRDLSFYPIEGDLEHLPFKDAVFDLVFLGWTLHHFPSLEGICSELCRVLKPGGKIAAVEPNEANLAMKLSRFIEDSLSPIILKIGWDTPNRTIHDYRDYLREFERRNITNLEHSSCYAPLPAIINSNNFVIVQALKLIIKLRAIVFGVSTKILPRPLNGPDLLITGIKPS